MRQVPLKRLDDSSRIIPPIIKRYEEKPFEPSMKPIKPRLIIHDNLSFVEMGNISPRSMRDLPYYDPVPDSPSTILSGVIPRFKPSRGLPEAVKEKYPDYLLDFFDYFFDKLAKVSIELMWLGNIDRCPSSALGWMIYETGLPVPDFISAPQARKLLHNAAEINSYRNTTHGWELYLQSIAGDDLVVTVTMPLIVKDRMMFSPNKVGYMIPNYAMLDSAGSPASKCVYLYRSEMFDMDLHVHFVGSGMTVKFIEFVEATVDKFLPMASGHITVHFTYVHKDKPIIDYTKESLEV